jgi:hypothetical protein
VKKTDIAMIVLIATISVVIAFFVTNSIMGNAATDEQQVDTIERITLDEALTPDPDIFNVDAINPTVEVQVGSADEAAGETTEETTGE